ncbi:hypothetical protein ACKVMT_10030 [Halobacteriales archaeon Cl-PHB]
MIPREQDLDAETEATLDLIGDATTQYASGGQTEEEARDAVDQVSEAYGDHVQEEYESGEYSGGDSGGSNDSGGSSGTTSQAEARLAAALDGLSQAQMAGLAVVGLGGAYLVTQEG